MLSKFWIWLIMVGIIGTVFYIIYNYNLELFNFRGSIWYFSFMGFCDGTLWQKLLGVGPALLDTVTQAQIAKADFYVEWNWLYCTAHNDLLEYLVTMGVFGAACRLLMYVLPFVMYTKGKERKPEKAAVLAALVGYLGQGLFTGPYILTYVLYTIFLGVLGAYCRMEKKKEQKHEYSAILVCALGTDQKRIEAKICQKFSGDSVELCVSVDAYGIGCGIVLDHFQ